MSGKTPVSGHDSSHITRAQLELEGVRWLAPRMLVVLGGSVFLYGVIVLIPHFRYYIYMKHILKAGATVTARRSVSAARYLGIPQKGIVKEIGMSPISGIMVGPIGTLPSVTHYSLDELSASVFDEFRDNGSTESRKKPDDDRPRGHFGIAPLARARTEPTRDPSLFSFRKAHSLDRSRCAHAWAD